MQTSDMSTGMQERVNSRNGLVALGAVAFLAGAASCLLAPGPVALRWIGAVFLLLGAGLGWRWLFPIDAVLTVDETGVRWSLDRREQSRMAWSEALSWSQGSEDLCHRFGRKGQPDWRVPAEFLREASQRERFIGCVAAARPDLQLRHD